MKKNRGRRLLNVVLALAMIIAACDIMLGIYMKQQLCALERTPAMSAESAGVSEEVRKETALSPIENIAVFGMDHDGGAGSETMDRSDAIKIISVNRLTHTVKITSVQRDTLVWIPDPVNDFSKWNHACWWGGAQLGIKTLNMNLDLDITSYAAFSFKAVEALTDALGGIDISLSDSEAYSLASSVPGFAYGGAGSYHLDGEAALAYCRIRSIDSDFYRMERQNTVIRALAGAFVKLGVTHADEVLDAVLPYVETNLSDRRIRSLVTSALVAEIAGVKTYQLPQGGMDDVAAILSYGGYSPLYRLKSYEGMIKDLHAFIYGEKDYEVSSQAKQIEQRIGETFGY